MISWLKRHADPLALKSAVRAAIVMPAVFGFADGVIGNSDTTLFSAFGSFAVLVLADFGGPPRRRLAGYVSLTIAGAALITLGTLCSQEAWLAVAGMGVVGFAILFGRLLGGYYASGSFAAMLLFIIPIGVPGPISSIPDRLAGWFLAAGIGTAATLLLWPTRHLDALRAGAARACRAIADLIDPALPADPDAIAGRAEEATAAVNQLRRSFVSTPLRPTRPTGPSEAVAFLVDALEWLLPVAASTRTSGARFDPCGDENSEVSSVAATVLRTSADNLEGRRGEPPLDRLDQAADDVEAALALRLEADARRLDAGGLLNATKPSFRMRELAALTREIGINAQRAVGVVPATERGRSAVRRTMALLRAHATPKSASFRNSLRGAIALAAAVSVIEAASVQHGFWIVLATLSVLRSTALGIGSTIFEALGGTIVGIVVGGLLIYAIGSDQGVLWALLPVAVLVAAYTSRAMPFAAGQAGFTVTVLTIFNILVPTGWTLGLVRVEDVAIGCGIGLAVGLLFWPRGIESLIRRSLGAAFARGADYGAAATRRLAGGPAGDALHTARAEARSAADRLDDAFRQFLAEPYAQGADRDRISTLVSGATAVRLTAYSLSTFSQARSGGSLDECAEKLTSEADDVRSWYVGLGEALSERSAVAPPGAQGDGDGGPVARCVTRALATDDGGYPAEGLVLLWADHHLSLLWRRGIQLAEPASELADARTGRKASVDLAMQPR